MPEIFSIRLEGENEHGEVIALEDCPRVRTLVMTNAEFEAVKCAMGLLGLGILADTYLQLRKVSDDDRTVVTNAAYHQLCDFE